MTLFQTRTFDIDLAQARLLHLPYRKDIPVRVGPVPVVPLDSGITAYVRQFGNVPTRTAILELGTSVMGMTMMRSASDVAIVLYDVAEPSVRRWLGDGIADGALRFGLRSDKHLCVVDADICEMTQWLGRLAELSEPCSFEALTAAIDEVMTALHEPEGLRRLSLDDLAFAKVTVAVVTPFEDLRPSSSTLN